MRKIILYLFFFCGLLTKGISQNVCKDNTLMSNFDRTNFLSDSLFLDVNTRRA